VDCPGGGSFADLRCIPATVVAAAQRFQPRCGDGLDQRARHGPTNVDESFLAELCRGLLSVPIEAEYSVHGEVSIVRLGVETAAPN
jgi:hypothetical protein